MANPCKSKISNVQMNQQLENSASEQLPTTSQSPQVSHGLNLLRSTEVLIVSPKSRKRGSFSPMTPATIEPVCIPHEWCQSARHELQMARNHQWFKVHRPKGPHDVFTFSAGTWDQQSYNVKHVELRYVPILNSTATVWPPSTSTSFNAKISAAAYQAVDRKSVV